MSKRETLLLAIKRIKGQLDGITKMIEEERSWLEISTQIKAATAGMIKVNQQLLTQNIQICCEGQSTRQEMTEQISEMMTIFLKIQSF